MQGVEVEMLSESGNRSRDENANKYGGAPLVFMLEKRLFGDRLPAQSEWLKHEELYESVGSIIEPTHIIGLQRVRGMWRIYVETLDDKVTLLTQGVTLRGKSIDLLHTNPLRLDGEGTTRIRVKNIPLSVDDNVIKHTLIQKGLDVITLTREKLRIKGKLTNCQTGDRLVSVKTLTLKEPLPPTLSFGQFSGRVIHYGQPKQARVNPITCGKCLENGHRKSECQNDWKCVTCKQSGHRKGDCPMPEVPSGTPLIQDNASESTNDGKKQDPVIKAKRSGRKLEKASGQTVMDSYVQTMSSTTETPNRGKKQNVAATDRSPPTPAEILNEQSKKGKLTPDDPGFESDG